MSAHRNDGSSTSARIGLIADTHVPESGATLWPQVLDAFTGVDAIIHAGDIYDVAVLDVLSGVAGVWAVRGNGDDGSGGRIVQPDHERLQPHWTVGVAGLRIGVVHDLPIFEAVRRDAARTALRRAFGDEHHDVVVYGDTISRPSTRSTGSFASTPGRRRSHTTSSSSTARSVSSRSSTADRPPASGGSTLTESRRLTGRRGDGRSDRVGPKALVDETDLERAPVSHPTSEPGCCAQDPGALRYAKHDVADGGVRDRT